MRPEVILLDCGGTLSWPPFDRLDRILADLRGRTIGVDAHYRAYYRGTHALDEYLRDHGHYPVSDSLMLNHWIYEQGIAREGFPGLWTHECTMEVLRRDRRLGNWDFTFAWIGECLAQLKSAGYRLAVVSNSDGHVRELLEQLDYAQYLEAIVDSAIEQVWKPDARLFYIGLERMGLAHLAAAGRKAVSGAGPKPPVLYVGDSYRSDYLGALNAGLAVRLIDPLELYRDWTDECVRDMRALTADMVATADSNS